MTQTTLATALGALGESLTQAVEQKFEARIKELEAIVAKPPVLTVKVGDRPEVRLKSRANKNLARMIKYAKLGHNIMMFGPSGCGKSTAARQLAESLELPYAALSCSEGMSEAWIFGRIFATGEYQESSFVQKYANGGVMNLEEFDAMDSNTFLNFNEALSNDSFYNPITGKVIKRHKDFICTACANTNGLGSDFKYTGRNRLDDASLDRFAAKLVFDYDSDVERDICPNDIVYNALTESRKQFKARDLSETISTRLFKTMYESLEVGVSMSDLLNDVTSTWSEEAGKILRDEIKKAAKAAKAGN